MTRSRTYLSILALAGLAAATGCESFSAAQPRVHTISDTVRVDDTSETASQSAPAVELWAGDELGRAMFEQHTRMVRARQQQSDEATLVQSQAQ